MDEDLKPTRHKHRNLILGSIALIFLLWSAFVLSTPKPTWGVDFSWEAGKGFSYVQAHCPKSSGVFEMLGRAYCRLIAIESKPFIAREFRKYGWTRAEGYITVVTLNPFPIVVSLSRLTPWRIVDPKVAPLMRAAEDGNAEQVRKLISAGAAVNSADQQGYTALTYACLREHPNPEVVQMLILSGANVNEKDRFGNSPLLNLIGHSGDDANSIEIAKILVHGGADISIRNADGETALVFALKVRRFKIAEFLRQSGLESHP